MSHKNPDDEAGNASTIFGHFGRKKGK